MSFAPPSACVRPAGPVPSGDQLTVPVLEALPGVLVVAPTGEVDIASAPLLRRVVFDVVATRPVRVVVDLSGLTFCGSTGLVVLVEAQRRAHGTGVGFCTAGAGRPVRRVLDVTGLGPVLGHRDSLVEALAADG